MEFLDLKAESQTHRALRLRAIEQVLDRADYILGEEVSLLETALANYVGVQHAVATSNGTDSLLISLLALGIGKGDEVITVPFTWISSVSSILFARARPLFVDIHPDTYLIDEEQIEEKITPRTKAILVVSLFGQMPNFHRIHQIAQKHHLAVIEDGAQSFGATQNGVKSGAVTHVGTTSFFPSKPLGCCGDGGAIFTNDEALADKLRMIRNHGKNADGLHEYIGINGRMDTLQAAILLAKLPFYPEELRQRQQKAKIYSENFPNPPVISLGNTHIFSQYTIREKNRDELLHRLRSRNISVRIYYPRCVYEHPAYAFLSQGTFPESEKACKEVLSLPVHPWLSESKQNEIIEAMQWALV